MAETENRPYTGKWYDERNQRRKKEYAANPAYRENQQKLSRASYRKSNGVELFDPRKNLPIIHTFGTEINNQLRFAPSQFAKALGKSAKQVRQWIADGRIPRPNADGFYTRPEVDAMIQALGPTLSEFAYFRTDHVEAIADVHEAVRALRA